MNGKRQRELTVHGLIWHCFRLDQHSADVFLKERTLPQVGAVLLEIDDWQPHDAADLFQLKEATKDVGLR
jgi:uncharacterized damage-inducible protein DinB